MFNLKDTAIILVTLWVMLFIFTNPSFANPEIDQHDDVVQAVMKDPVVQAELARRQKGRSAPDVKRENVSVVRLGGGCGVAGCSQNYLVAIKFYIRRGANPATGSVLATIGRSPRGKLGEVSVVELKRLEKGVNAGD